MSTTGKMMNFLDIYILLVHFIYDIRNRKRPSCFDKYGPLGSTREFIYIRVLTILICFKPFEKKA